MKQHIEILDLRKSSRIVKQKIKAIIDEDLKKQNEWNKLMGKSLIKITKIILSTRYTTKINIGKMMEILGEIFLGLSISSLKKWQVSLDYQKALNYDVEKHFRVVEADNMCDALWEAVKWVLEQEEADG